MRRASPLEFCASHEDVSAHADAHARVQGRVRAASSSIFRRLRRMSPRRRALTPILVFACRTVTSQISASLAQFFTTARTISSSSPSSSTPYQRRASIGVRVTSFPRRSTTASSRDAIAPATSARRRESGRARTEPSRPWPSAYYVELRISLATGTRALAARDADCIQDNDDEPMRLRGPDPQTPTPSVGVSKDCRRREASVHPSRQAAAAGGRKGCGLRMCRASR